jgi:AcrR family transcriptional regulator
MRSKKQVVSEFRRAEIVDAARAVFARRGFAQGIMDEIAKQAGMAKGTVYLYFQSKAAIYKAVMDQDMQLLRDSTLQRIDAAGSLREKIAAFTLVRLENAEAKKEFFQIMDSASGDLSFTRGQYRDWLRDPVLRLAASIEEASSRGEIRQVPAEKVAWVIADITRGAIQRRLLGRNDAPPGEESAFLTGFVWASLTVDPEARQP